ncbi:uncharacterized protein LOC141595648 [Silene latifolia]|uniref:uncharacterized protein LOC141595648 n=1 Tax=Silene latifolia TaxID=37657 RepID=UPI003D78A8ED
MSLKSRRKFGFCDGTVKKPTDQFMLEQWEVVNCTIVQWLLNTIDPSVLTSVPYVEEAAALWFDLEERFAVVDGTSLHALKTALGNCKQAKGIAVTAYYGQLKSLWDELVVREPPFARKCGRCLCDISSQAIQRLDNERLHQYFMGLDISLHGNLRTQQFQLEPLPTLNRGYHVALQVECLLGEASSLPSSQKVPDVMVYAVPGSLNKFPDWWSSRPRTLAELHRGKGQVAGAGGVGGSGAGSTGGQGRVDDGDLTLFVEQTAISPRPVALPNGQRLMATIMGTDRSSRMMIGVSKLRDGLYLLRLEDKFSINTLGMTWSYDLWHRILGDHKAVKFIPLASNVISNKHLTSCIGTPQQNEGVERKHRHILNVAQALRFQGNLPKHFWGECILTTAYLINCTPSTLLAHKLPYEVLLGVSSSYRKLRVFGCLCFAHNQKTHSDKYEPRSRKCIFLGYPHNKKGWKVYDLETEMFFISRDVIFHEDSFFFITPITPASLDPTSIPFDDEPPESPEPASESHTTTQTEPSTMPNAEPDATDVPNVEPPVEDPPVIPDLDRGHRIKIPNSLLRGYVLDTTNSPSSSSSPSLPSSPSGTSYTLANYVNCERFSSRHKTFLAAITAGVEPLSFRIVIRDDRWCRAMHEEITAIEKNDTWVPCSGAHARRSWSGNCLKEGSNKEELQPGELITPDQASLHPTGYLTRVWRF